jgi:hypothetical protein
MSNGSSVGLAIFGGIVLGVIITVIALLIIALIQRASMTGTYKVFIETSKGKYMELDPVVIYEKTDTATQETNKYFVQKNNPIHYGVRASAFGLKVYNPNEVDSVGDHPIFLRINQNFMDYPTSIYETKDNATADTVKRLIYYIKTSDSTDTTFGGTATVSGFRPAPNRLHQPPPPYKPLPPYFGSPPPQFRHKGRGLRDMRAGWTRRR